MESVEGINLLMKLSFFHSMCLLYVLKTFHSRTCQTILEIVQKKKKCLQRKGFRPTQLPEIDYSICLGAIFVLRYNLESLYLSTFKIYFFLKNLSNKKFNGIIFP